jgi:MFS family permease
MRLLTDITPLRENPAFRRLWLGTMLSQTGSAMTTFAVTLQVWDITSSTAAVGGLAAATLVPMVLIALPGGSLADRFDRRRLVLVMTVLSAAVSALLLADAALRVAWVWPLYGLAAVSSGISAISAPARTTFIPRLVAPRQRAAAMALNRIIFQVVLIAGPALAGVIAAAAGVKGCYLADTVSFAGGLWGVGGLPAMPPEARGVAGGTAGAAGGRPRSGLALTVEGLSFIGRSRVLAGAFLADVNATFFGLPTSLFPAINAERFGGDPRTLGLFTTAIGVGGLVSAVFAGPLRHISRHGLGMLACVAVWGAGFALFAVAPWLWLTLLALGLAGLADTFTVVLRGMIVQAVTPDEFRGRVSAADYLVGAGGGQLGSLEAGIVGSLTTPVISALSGGLLTVAGAVAIGAALPGFRKYRAPEAAAEAADAVRTDAVEADAVETDATGPKAVDPDSADADSGPLVPAEPGIEPEPEPAGSGSNAGHAGS